MPEEDLETTELKERIEAGVEHALHAGHAGEPDSARWIRYLSLSTAIIAVCAAIASLESGANSNEAILAKNEAVLNQSRASDQWAYYQAKGVKAALAAGQAEVIPPEGAALASRLRAEADRYRAEQAEIEKLAHELEARVKESNERSERLMERHHRFALSVTLFQIAIALCAVAALTRRRTLWLVGIAASAVALGFFGTGLLAPG